MLYGRRGAMQDFAASSLHTMQLGRYLIRKDDRTTG